MSTAVNNLPILNKESKQFGDPVVIVGGGPAGLATALMLAKRGWTNITVFEKRPSADYYEPDKSYSFSIDGRGQKIIDFLGLIEELPKIGVPRSQLSITRIEPDGTKKTSKSGISDPNRKISYVLSRKAFLKFLYQEIEQKWSASIKVLFNAKCIEIEKSLADDVEGKKIEIVASLEKGGVMKFQPTFLVGCDGINSVVRQTLNKWDSSDKFEMKYFPSPSTGLRYKVLTLPPNFPLERNGNDLAVHDQFYSIDGAISARQLALFLALFPSQNPEEPRSAILVKPPDHKVWQLKDREQVYDYLELVFPQLPIREIVSPEEAERFAASEGGSFPPPQYCSQSHFILGEDRSFNAGVLLIGDAIHCFPPDIGQGVNAALEDVYVLNDALSQSNDDLSLALPLYESLRSSDTKALVHLAQITSPWQYNQNPFRKRLWNINFLFRRKLSQWLPFLFNPPAVFLIQNHRLSYSEIWQKVKRSTLNLYLFGVAIALWVFALLLKTS